MLQQPSCGQWGGGRGYNMQVHYSEIFIVWVANWHIYYRIRKISFSYQVAVGLFVFEFGGSCSRFSLIFFNAPHHNSKWLETKVECFFLNLNLNWIILMYLQQDWIVLYSCLIFNHVYIETEYEKLMTSVQICNVSCQYNFIDKNCTDFCLLFISEGKDKYLSYRNKHSMCYNLSIRSYSLGVCLCNITCPSSMSNVVVLIIGVSFFVKMFLCWAL